MEKLVEKTQAHHRCLWCLCDRCSGWCHWSLRCSDTEVIYKETTVKYGTLVKGVTESGSVDIGTVDQTFDLDMSALQRTDTSGSSSSGGSSGSTAGSNSGSGGFGGMSASGGGAQGGLDTVWADL